MLFYNKILDNTVTEVSTLHLNVFILTGFFMRRNHRKIDLVQNTTPIEKWKRLKLNFVPFGAIS
jgi:hypothetical protein